MIRFGNTYLPTWIYQQLSYLKRLFRYPEGFNIFSKMLCRSNAHGYRLFHAVDVGDEVKNLIGITPLVVVPGNQLHEVACKRDAGRRIEDGRMGVAEDIAGNDSVFRIWRNYILNI